MWDLSGFLLHFQKLDPNVGFIRFPLAFSEIGSPFFEIPHKCQVRNSVAGFSDSSQERGRRFTFCGWFDMEWRTVPRRKGTTFDSIQEEEKEKEENGHHPRPS